MSSFLKVLQPWPLAEGPNQLCSSFFLLVCISTLPKDCITCLSRKHEDTSHAAKKNGVRIFSTCMNYIPHRTVPVLLLSTRYHCSFTALLASPNVQFWNYWLHTFFPDITFVCPASLIAISARERSVRYTEVSNLQTQLKGSFSVLGTWDDSWGEEFYTDTSAKLLQTKPLRISDSLTTVHRINVVLLIIPMFSW